MSCDRAGCQSGATNFIQTVFERGDDKQTDYDYGFWCDDHALGLDSTRDRYAKHGDDLLEYVFTILGESAPYEEWSVYG